ncbi:hypothetical protein CVT24_012865 [Panaeolus cyanescens]|uniref:Uncharacterized protein n=1 Tax=Panaeolus cyanescens TaxID=181874 RepID=A0A409WQZ2_9AGAR|nr:hypothetical protein CVT24_012865 [Panaeolus cyanescens]
MFEWTAGSIWATYCYQQHDNDSYDWRPVRYLGNNTIVLRSKQCKQKLVTTKENENGRCAKCASLLFSRSVLRSLERAKNAKPHTPYKFLTPNQLIAALRSSGGKVKRLEAENTSLRRVIFRLRAKRNAWQSITMKIAHNDIPGASQAIEIALNHKESPEAVLECLDAICQGLYRPTGNWNSRDLDVAFLVKALGGPLLLYTMQKAKHFPSRTTLSRRKKMKKIPELLVSIDRPTREEIQHNIEQFLGEKSGRKPPKNIEVGLNLMIDGIALEEVPRYDRKRNAVLGLCHEHSSGQNKHVHKFSDLSKLRAGLESGHWHRSKDGVVLAIAPVTAEENYDPIPLLLFGSCKSETEEAITSIISDFLDVFNSHSMGRARWGPILEFSTDGEAGFRGARFNLGLQTPMAEIPALNDALPVLSEIKGFNLYSAPDGMVTSCDPKHIVKRLASSVRSDSAIQLGDTIIKKADVRSVFLSSGIAPEKVNKLLDPLDKQNVPVAVNVIEEMERLDLSLLRDRLNPSEFRKAQRIRTLGKIFSYFVAPFTNVRMSLSEQICSLATYMYVVFALEHNYGGKFMKGFLYGDSMSIVKSIIILAARLQKVDPDILFYIFLIGTDRIEGLFSYVRTQDHARNVDIFQLCHKICIAAEIAAIFERYPDLYRGHRRRNMADKDGVDHVNPKSWLGDVKLANIDIVRCTSQGLENAKRFLNDELGIQFDFEATFSNEGIDVLRPHGSYIGSRAADKHLNDSQPDSEDLDNDMFDEPSSLSNIPTPPLDNPFVPPSDEETAAFEFDSDLNPNEDHSDHSEMSNAERPTGGNPELIEYEGKMYYKSSMVATILISDSARKVTIRPYRAAGFSMKDIMKFRLGTTSKDGGGSHVEDDSTPILSSDLGATVVRVGNILCLAVIEVQHFLIEGSRYPVYEISESQLDNKATTVIGYALELTRLPDQNCWMWTQKYIPQLRETSQPLSAPTDKDFAISISGPHFYPICGTSTLSQSSHDDRSNPTIPDTPDNENQTPTWIINHSLLSETMNLIWDTLNIGDGGQATLSTLQTLPTFDQLQLPYRSCCVEPELFFSRNLTGSQFKKHKADDEVKCRCCNITVKLRSMRDHVAKHILRSMRTVEDSLLPAGFQIGANPCGWCGLDDCEYHHEKMVYTTAARFNSKRRSSTNVPVPCSLCAQKSPDPSQLPTFWKYNLLHHMLTNHLTPECTLPPCPPEMVVSCHIRREEELYMGIAKQHTDRFRDLAHVPNSDDIDVIAADLKRRERSASNATTKVGRGKKKKKNK